MKILAVSDIHGARFSFERILEEEKPDVLIFSGDGEKDVTDTFIPAGVTPYLVCGNEDHGSTLLKEQHFELCSKHIMLCHSNLYDSRNGLGRLISAAHEKGADILFYGHTHIQNEGEDEGLYFLNPGCFRDGKYAVLELSEKAHLQLKSYDARGTYVDAEIDWF